MPKIKNWASWNMPRNIQIDEFIEDVVSGTKDWEKRALGNMVQSAKTGDVLLFSEVYRIVRSSLQCLQVLQICANKKLMVHVAKQQMVFDNSLNSKIIAATLSLASEIEYMFISMRTKKAKANGKKSTNAQVVANHDQIERLLKDKVSGSAIGRMIKLKRKTISRYIERHLPMYIKSKNGE